MEQKKNRSSNIELLRIVAMLMVISYHIIYHSVNHQLTDTASMAYYQNGWFSKPVFFKKLWILDFFLPLGPAGNAIFLLISGYFLVRKGDAIHLTSTAKKLLYQLGFATVILVFVSTLFYRLTGNTSIALIDISCFNTMGWFAGYYFLVMLAAKLGLNKFLSQLNQKRYLGFLIVLFALVSIRWTGELAESLAKTSRTLGIGIFLYALGGFIRAYEPFQKLKTWVFVLIIFAVYGLLFISSHNIAVLGIENFTWGFTQEPFVQSLQFYYNFNIIVVILGVVLFELCRRIHLPCIRCINFIGSSTFMVYLFHDNSFFRSFWQQTDWITLLHTSVKGFLLTLVFWVIFTFSMGILTYTGYLLFENLLHRCRHFFITEA